MKFNKPHTIKRQMKTHPDAVQNYEGGLSYITNPCMKLGLSGPDLSFLVIS